MATKPSKRAKLTYFEGRGIGEVCRLTLLAAGFNYEDVYLRSREDLTDLRKRGKLMFGQVPLLETHEGEPMIGSEPIVRFIGQKYGLCGATEEEQKMVDMLSMGARDCLRSGFTTYMQEYNESTRDEMLKKAKRMAKFMHLPAFEQRLTKSCSGFLVGDSLTLADIFLFDTLSYINDDCNTDELLIDFPNCKEFITKIANMSQFKAYLKSPRRHEVADRDYARLCREIISE